MSCFYDAVTNNKDQSLLWRVHTLAWAAKNALNVEGDFVECGVFKGFCSPVLLKYLDYQDIPRKAYLYDTFEGLPEKKKINKARETFMGLFWVRSRGCLYWRLRKICQIQTKTASSLPYT
jgi:hypothetical protein